MLWTYTGVRLVDLGEELQKLVLGLGEEPRPIEIVPVGRGAQDQRCVPRETGRRS